ncbi:MAG: lipocalin-like domain-containing protein [Bacteroidota bacterium]
MSRFLFLLVLGLGLVGTLAFVLQPEGEAQVQTALSVAEAMGGDTTGYARADVVRPFIFPADHGPHPDFKTEWWYYTGNLTAEDGHRFGYQVTLFRIGLAPPAVVPTSSSDWATRQLYMGHFAVSDLDERQFYDAERFSRGAAGLAGAQASPFRVWLEDWTIFSADPSGLPMEIEFATDEVALDLTLTPAKPHVLQGDRGLDPKGEGVGNASYYYSFTRLNTTGTVTVGTDTRPVSGLSWLDREWSTSALDDNQVGWDWFALQLSNGYDLMYYQIREADGTPSRFTHGVVVDPAAESVQIDGAGTVLTVTDTWTSPLTGGTYPTAWRFENVGQGVDLTLTAFFPEQELDTSVRYWEGAVQIEGTMRGEPVTGRGYVEMTGYGDDPSRAS